MELSEILRVRRSVRKFTPEAVSQSDIETLMHAAMAGPSACNKQPWEFYVITDPPVLEQLRHASRFSNITAPLDIVVCGNLDRALPREMAPYWVQDCSAATQNILLQAVELGLGAVWCGIHPQPRAEERVRAALDLPPEQIPLNIIHIGHPESVPEARDWYESERVHFI